MFLNKIFSNKKLKSTVSLLLAFSIIMSLIIPAYSAADITQSGRFNDDVLSGGAVDAVLSGGALEENGIRLYADAESLSQFSISCTNHENGIWDAAGENNANAGHAYQFDISYTMGGTGNVEPGRLKIKIPLHILKDFNGKNADSIELSCPSEAEAADNSGSVLCYKIVGNDVIITNIKTIPNGTVGHIAVAYSTTQKTTRYNDCFNDSNDENKTLDDVVLTSGNRIGAFTAQISEDGGTTYKTPSQYYLTNKDEIPVGMNTRVIMGEPEKTILSENTQLSYDEMVSKCKFESNILPDDTNKDDYYYYIWDVKTEIKNVTKQYSFSISDAFYGKNDPNGEGVTGGDGHGSVVAICTSASSAYKLTTSATTGIDNNLDKEGIRNDRIITRYPKSELEKDESSGQEKAYELYNQARCTLNPRKHNEDNDPDVTKTAVGVLEFIPTPPPHYEKPSFSVESRKYGIYASNRHVNNSGNISSYELENLANDGGKISGLTYEVTADVMPYRYTIPESLRRSDADLKSMTSEQLIAYNANYGKIPVQQDISDNALYFNGEETKLGAADYSFESLNIGIVPTEYVFDSTKLVYIKEAVTTYDPDETVELYLEINGSGTYVLAATINLEKNTYNIIDTEHISAIYGTSVSFKTDTDHITGWKVTTKNTHYLTKYNIFPKVTLYASPTVKTQVAALKAEADALTDTNLKGKYRSMLKNDAHFDTIVYNDDTGGKNIVKDEAEVWRIEGAEPKTVRVEDKTATDYLSTVSKSSKITKTCASVTNQPLYRNCIVPWTVTASETQIGFSGGEEGVHQVNGRFYDLIPDSGRADLDTIEVYADGRKLDEYMYTASVTQDYKNSGRELLVVDITEPSNGTYTLKYNTVHPWADIMEFGKYAINYAAYETGNANIANGYPDNGGNSGIANFVDLDPETNDKKFIYAQASTNLNVLIFTHTGIMKRVAVDLDSEFTEETVVNPDSQYIYRITLVNHTDTKAKEIIIIDPMENYVVKTEVTEAEYNALAEADRMTEDGKYYQLTRQDWRGTLDHIDISRLERKGAKPVIYVTNTDPGAVKGDQNKEKGQEQYGYISDIANLSTSTTNPCTWTKVEFEKQSDGTYKAYTVDGHVEYDLASVRGICFDITKDKNGEPYKLDKGMSLSIDVYMHSPDNLPDEVKDNKTCNTYNNIYFSGRTISFSGIASSDHDAHESDDTNWTKEGTNNDYTTVSYRINGNLSIEKVSVDGDPIEGVRFRLESVGDGENMGTTYYGNEYSRILTTDINGRAFINGLERGTYKLTEIYAPVDYRVNNTVRIIDVDDQGHVSVRNKDEDFAAKDDENGVTTEGTRRAEYLVTDKDRIHGDLKFYKYKYNKDNPEALTGAKFRLYGTSAYGNAINKEGTSTGASGEVVIDDIELGTYTLEETTYPSGIIPVVTKYTVVCNNDGQILIKNYTTDGTGSTLTGTEKAKYYIDELGGRTYLYNQGFKDVTIKKVDAFNTTESLYGAKFRLVSSSIGVDLASAYDATQEKVSNVRGLVTFTHLVPGTYTLTEIEAPANHDLLTDTLTLTLDVDGEVTVTGNGSNLIVVENVDDEGNYGVKNERQYNEKVYVIKKWQGGAPTFGEDAFPVINLSAAVPKLKKVATINRASFNNKFTSNKVYDFVRLDLDTVKNYGSIDDVRSDYPALTFTEVQTDDPNEHGKIYMAADNSNANPKMYFWSDAEIIYLPQNCNEMFKGRVKGDVDLSLFNSERVNDMSSMFQDCTNLKSVNMKNCTGEKLETTSSMFNGCKTLEYVDISGLTNTPNLNNTSSMFKDCEKLKGTNSTKNTALDIRGLNTANVTDMSSMFEGCKELTKIDLDHTRFTAADKLTTAASMFNGCEYLSGIDLRGFGECPNLTTLENIFYKCKRITYIDWSNFQTSENLVNIEGLFYYGGQQQSISDSDYGNKRKDKGVKIFSREGYFNFSTATTGENKLMTKYTSIDWLRVNMYGNLFKNSNVFEKGWSIEAARRYFTVQEYKGENGNYDTQVAENGQAADSKRLRYGIFMNADSDYYTAWATATYTPVTSSAAVEESKTSYFAALAANAENSPIAAFADSNDGDLTESYVTGQAGTAVDPSDPDTAYTVSETINGDLADETATWSKISADTWICEIPVYNSESQFYVWEDEYTGYSIDTISTPKVMNEAGTAATGTQTLVNTKVGESVIIPPTGALKLTKKITKDDADYDDDTITKFKFRITFYDSSGVQFTDTQYWGTLKITGGVVETELKAGQTFAIEDIPEGVQYKIEELGPNGTVLNDADKYYGYHTDLTDVTGTISSTVNPGTENEGITSETWENKVDIRDRVDLSVTKSVKLYKKVYVDGVWDGNPDVEIPLTDTESNAEFSYEAEFTQLDRSASYDVYIDGEKYSSFTSNTEGNGGVHFTIKHGQTAVFENLPKNARATVTEAAASGYKAVYKIGDGAETPASPALNTALATSEITLDENKTVAYTNTKLVEESVRSYITLKVRKIWDGLSDAASQPNSVNIKLSQYEKIVETEAVKDGEGNIIVPEQYYLQSKNFSIFAHILKDNDWIVKLDNILKYSSKGNLYVYKLEESDMPGFELKSMKLNGADVDLENGIEISGETVKDNVVEITNRKVNTYDFTLKKTVTGNMGNREKKFVFSLRFENTAKDVDGIYEVWDSGVYVRQIAINFGHTDDFILSSGEALTIKGLPEGTKVTVTEVRDVEYTTKCKVDSGTAEEGVYSAYVVLEGADKEHSIEFINSRNAMLPTGITEHPIAAAAAGVFMILGIIILLIRRRRYA